MRQLIGVLRKKERSGLGIFYFNIPFLSGILYFYPFLKQIVFRQNTDIFGNSQRIIVILLTDNQYGIPILRQHFRPFVSEFDIPYPVFKNGFQHRCRSRITATDSHFFPQRIPQHVRILTFIAKIEHIHLSLIRNTDLIDKRTCCQCPRLSVAAGSNRRLLCPSHPCH